VHNPRAEEAKDKGCSHETFMQLMREDDEFDADLTPLGVSQGQSVKARYLQLQKVELVVSSPLSRALKTADLAMCPEEGLLPPPPPHNHSGHGEGSGVDEGCDLVNLIKKNHPARICVEHFREINGSLLNAKRRDRADLKERFHSRWDFESCMTETDTTWTEALESVEDCGERGYQGFLWLSQRQEDNILVVCHGGILRFSMSNNPNVIVVDKRDDTAKRFVNCELREYIMTLSHCTQDVERPLVTLTEVPSD